MENNFENHVKRLRTQITRLLKIYANTDIKYDKLQVTIPKEFENDFFELIDKVNFHLMDDNENFFGYFLLQMDRAIRFDMSSPTGVNFKNAKYVMYFNPLIFLKLEKKQMETMIKHEILHILSLHLLRSRKLKETYDALALNMAMDIVVNEFLTHLPVDATTLEWVNKKYSLTLEKYKPFEYYADKLQLAIAKQKKEEDKQDDVMIKEELFSYMYDPQKTHDIWEESSDMDDNTLEEFTKQVAESSQKGEIPAYIDTLIKSIQSNREELPWELYLARLMGRLSSNKKKTITRRNRRQPIRLDLKGELSSHKARILIAIDISGSISETEFKGAMTEVLGIVHNYGHEITIVECDDTVKRSYKIKSKKDLKDPLKTKGGTKFTPVFEFANQSKTDLLIYFTDGKGEDRLGITPKGYKILWVISGKGDKLSVQEPYGAIKKLKKVEIKEDILDYSDVERGGFSMHNHERIL